MEKLIFIDTNIYLDFYRISNNELNKKILDKVLQNKDKIIGSFIVEMEFKKNRERIMLDLINKSTNESVSHPTFIRDRQIVKTMKKKEKELKTQNRKLKKHIVDLIEKPSKDAIYKDINQLFNLDTDIYLKDDIDIYNEIENKAKKRFLLGYPPRKAKDISMGDAINWEWVIACANKKRADIAIVSRDCDYGTINKEICSLNNWLADEFKRRVSKKREIILTNKILEAIKWSGAKVSEKQIDQENEQMISNRNRLVSNEASDKMNEIIKIWMDYIERRRQNSK